MPTAIQTEKMNKTRNNIKSVIKETKAEQSNDANIFGELVEKKAYELYEKRGRQDGHDLEDWLEAQKLVEAEMIGID